MESTSHWLVTQGTGLLLYFKLFLLVDFPPHYDKAANGYALTVPNTSPPPLGTVEESFAAANRERIPPPLKSFDFLPDLMEKTEEGGYKPREGLKPLYISQPEGVSFKLDGHVLEWQGWKMHVGGQNEPLSILYY